MLNGTAVLYRRKNHKWKWVIGGNSIMTPRVGLNFMIARDKIVTTGKVESIIRARIRFPNVIEMIFQDSNAVWKLLVPAHTNDLSKMILDSREISA